MEQTHEVLSTSRPNRLIQALHRAAIIWDQPVYAALLTGFIFFVLSLLVRVPWRLSSYRYYNYLADAFLHGQVHLRLIPPSTLDLSFFQGQYYLYWGPLPAILSMPFVALLGVNFSDSFISLLIGSINVGLFAVLLQRVNQRELIRLEPLQRALLVIFFALGTAHAPLLPLGTVWHLAQLVAVTFALLAYLAALTFENQKAFFWTGCAMACVLATRTSVLFVAIFLVLYLLHRHWRQGYARLFQYCCVGAAPFAVVMLLLFAYNAARFGDPFDNGLAYHLMSDTFLEPYATYGVLNVHFIPANLFLNLFFYPFTSLNPLTMVPLGGSLFLLSPLYLASFVAVWEHRKESFTWFLFLTVLVGSIPSLLIMAPGSVAFGPRYLLDIAPPLLLLTASGIRRWPIPLVLVFTAISVIQYMLGTVLMVRSWF